MENKRLSKLEIARIENKVGKPKGHPKSGGRAKGTPNKSTSKWTEILVSQDFSIAEEAIGMFQHESTPPNIKLQILQFLAQYTTAAVKPKEVEVELPDFEPEIESNSDILLLVSSSSDK